MNTARIIRQASNHNVSAAEAEHRLTQAISIFAPLIEDLKNDKRTKELLNNDTDAIEALEGFIYSALIYHYHGQIIEVNMLMATMIVGINKIQIQL